MNKTIIFTHIPKTSGTSFIKSLIEPSGLKTYQYSRLSKFIRKDLAKVQFISGHLPFGLHIFVPNQTQYITFLRDPIERAISHYYFIKDCDINIYKHPLREYADSVSLKQFYENRKFQNLQTQFVAGFFYQKFLHRFAYIDKKMLAMAKNNLRKYYIYGILEQFNVSTEIISQKLQLTKKQLVPPQKKTNVKPSQESIDESTIKSLLAAHKLDIELYNFGVEYFLSQ
jgi:hypothetical protein